MEKNKPNFHRIPILSDEKKQINNLLIRENYIFLIKKEKIDFLRRFNEEEAKFCNLLKKRIQVNLSSFFSFERVVSKQLMKDYIELIRFRNKPLLEIKVNNMEISMEKRKRMMLKKSIVDAIKKLENFLAIEQINDLKFILSDLNYLVSKEIEIKNNLDRINALIVEQEKTVQGIINLEKITL